MKTNQLKDERGIALVIAMMLLLVTTLIGISAVTTTTYDNLISGNKRVSEQAFYITEAGINEFLGRFRSGATNEITDSAESNTTETTPPWRILLAKSSGMGATKLGAGDANTTVVTSLQTQLDFGVEVKHKVDGANPPNIIKYANKPIYIAKSYGFTPDGGNKVIEVEIQMGPSFDQLPSALYSEIPVWINGKATILGMDQCPQNGVFTNKAGIVAPSVTKSGQAYTITGTPPENTDPNRPNLPLNDFVNYLKPFANFSDSYTNDEILSNQSWGEPTLTDNDADKPLTYTGQMNIVYFDMKGNKTLTLSGGSKGGGILIVKGNLKIWGGFSWYGVVIVTGKLTFLGGGNKNITGGVLTGEDANIDEDAAQMGGGTAILYCQYAMKRLDEETPPLKMTRWKEVY